MNGSPSRTQRSSMLSNEASSLSPILQRNVKQQLFNSSMAASPLGNGATSGYKTPLHKTMRKTMEASNSSSLLTPTKHSTRQTLGVSPSSLRNSPQQKSSRRSSTSKLSLTPIQRRWSDSSQRGSPLSKKSLDSRATHLRQEHAIGPAGVSPGVKKNAKTVSVCPLSFLYIQNTKTVIRNSMTDSFRLVRPWILRRLSST